MPHRARGSAGRVVFGGQLRRSRDDALPSTPCSAWASPRRRAAFSLVYVLWRDARLTEPSHEPTAIHYHIMRPIVHHSKIRCRLAAMGQKPQLPHCNIEVRFTSVNGPTQALCMKGPDAAQLPLPRGCQFWLYGKIADTDRKPEAH